MAAKVKLDKVEVHNAHEDGGDGDGEWMLYASVNGQQKGPIKDGSVEDGDFLDMKDPVWTINSVDPGDDITFAGKAWEDDTPPDADDYMGTNKKFTEDFSKDYNDYAVKCGNYTMYFDIDFV